MGYSKVVKVSEREVRFVHQRNSDGTPYAEDVTLTVPDGVGPERIEHWAKMDGKVGILSFSFSPIETAPEDLIFDEQDSFAAPQTPEQDAMLDEYRESQKG